MARIPQGNFNTRLTTDVPRTPTQAVREAGAEGRALQQLGGAVAQAGVGFADLQDRREKAEAKNVFNNKKEEFRRQLAKFSEEAKLAKSGTDFKGFAEEKQKWIADQRKAMLDEVENPLAKQALDQFSNSISSSALESDLAYENRERAKHYIREDRLNRLKSAETARELGNLKYGIDSFRGMNDHILKSDSYDVNRKKEELEKNVGIMVETFEGMLHQGGAKVSEGLNFLKQDPKKSEVLSAIPPKVRQVYTDRFERKLQSEVTKSIGVALNKTESDIAEYNLNLQLGKTPSLAARETISENIERLNLLKEQVSDPLQKANIERAIASQSATFLNTEFHQDLKDTPVAKRLGPDGKPLPGKSIADVDPLEGAEDLPFDLQLKVLNERRESINKRIELARKDPALLAKQSATSLKEGSEDIIQWQVSQGISTPRFFSDKTAKSIRNMLEEAPNKVEAFKEFMGTYRNKGALLEIVGNKKELVPFALAADIKDPIALRQFIGFDKQAVNSEFTARGKSAENMTKLINKETQDLVEAFGSSTSFIAGFREQATAMAKHLVVNKGFKEEDAAKRAASVFNSAYDIMEVGGKKTIIPAEDAASKPKFEAFFKTYIFDEEFNEVTIKDLGLKLEDQVGIVKGDKPGQFRNMSEFLNQVRDQNMHLIRDKGDKLGYRVRYYTKSGAARDLMTSDANGNSIPFIVTKDTLDSSQFNQFILDQLNNDEVFRAKLEQREHGIRVKKRLEAARKARGRGTGRGPASREPAISETDRGPAIVEPDRSPAIDRTSRKPAITRDE